DLAFVAVTTLGKLDTGRARAAPALIEWLIDAAGGGVAAADVLRLDDRREGPIGIDRFDRTFAMLGRLVFGPNRVRRLCLSFTGPAGEKDLELDDGAIVDLDSYVSWLEAMSSVDEVVMIVDGLRRHDGLQRSARTVPYRPIARSPVNRPATLRIVQLSDD